MWTAAFILGLAGSLHCLGMCSPLALAVTPAGSKAMVKRLFYNAGRILTYAVIGMILGGAGSYLPLDSFQVPLSLGLGLVLLATAFFGLRVLRFSLVSRVIQVWVVSVKRLFSKMLERKNYLSTFVLGSINGLLPCGLTLVAFTFSVGQGNAIGGFMFMLLFGAGTLPVMLGITTVMAILVKRLKVNLSTLMTVLLFVSGMLLILRGVQAYNLEDPHFFSSAVEMMCR
jgi:uncharacterized protein